MSKWAGCPIIACKNDLCHDGCQVLKNCSKCGAMVDERFDCCEVHDLTKHHSEESMSNLNQQQRTDG